MRTDIMSTRTSFASGSAAAWIAALTFALGASASRASAQEATPTGVTPSVVEIGFGAVSDTSCSSGRDVCFKAGEYNGLAKQGAFAIANTNLRDQTPYGS